MNISSVRPSKTLYGAFEIINNNRIKVLEGVLNILSLVSCVVVIQRLNSIKPLSSKAITVNKVLTSSPKIQAEDLFRELPAKQKLEELRQEELRNLKTNHPYWQGNYKPERGQCPAETGVKESCEETLYRKSLGIVDSKEASSLLRRVKIRTSKRNLLVHDSSESLKLNSTPPYQNCCDFNGTSCDFELFKIQTNKLGFKWNQQVFDRDDLLAVPKDWTYVETTMGKEFYDPQCKLKVKAQWIHPVYQGHTYCADTQLIWKASLNQEV